MPWDQVPLPLTDQSMPVILPLEAEMIEFPPPQHKSLHKEEKPL